MVLNFWIKDYINIEMIRSNEVLPGTIEHHHNEKLIVVTGFGPFDGHELINASWEAVKLLPSDLKVNDISFKIEKQLVPVMYDEVNKAVDGIWSMGPELVVHCGVHGGSNCIRVEELAYNHKFSKPDYSGKKPENSSLCIRTKEYESCDRLCTKLDIDKIIDNISNVCRSKESVMKSDDVGNYLCGYIYLKSLDKDCKRSLFIHVPCINKPFTSQETSDIIFKIILECIKQIQEKSS